MADKISCGFGKWSIGVNENGEVIVDYNYHPIYGSITLHDASIEDLDNLGEMFQTYANLLRVKAKGVR